MKRLKDDFLDVIQSVVPFHDKDVLDIGCGDGSRTAQIAQVCRHVTGVDTDCAAVWIAQRLGIANCEIFHRSADNLGFKDAVFDVVIFTLSFHHIPPEKMNAAIDQALRVVRPQSHIIFFEPTCSGSFFDAEVQLGAFDGDERVEKELARVAMLAHPRLEHVAELYDETRIGFDSIEDFIESTNPRCRDEKTLRTFFRKHSTILTAKRRINIFAKKSLVLSV